MPAPIAIMATPDQVLSCGTTVAQLKLCTTPATATAKAKPRVFQPFMSVLLDVRRRERHDAAPPEMAAEEAGQEAGDERRRRECRGQVPDEARQRRGVVVERIAFHDREAHDQKEQPQRPLDA